MSQINDLATRLQAASNAYYNGVPVLSDAAFDALRDELAKLDPTHPFLKVVGAPVLSGGWQKTKHVIPMTSLNKVTNEAEFRAWGPNRHTMCITDKCDGLSISLVYENGLLVRGVTRGDGEIGEDITRNVKLMKGAVQRLPGTWPDGFACPQWVFVRGEIIIRHGDFAQYFPGESNPRNSASGTAKRQSDPDKCKHLTILAYQLFMGGAAPALKSMELDLLVKLGFQTPRMTAASSADDVMKVYQQYVATDRKALDYDIDGLVIDVNDRDVREGLGELNARPAGSVALKFPYDSKETTLRNIRWQVGASGRLTPVAEFDVVNLAGAMVKQASLHNLSIINDLWPKTMYPCAGDKVLVSRRNDVIPYLEEVLHVLGQGTVFVAPTKCPVCGSAVLLDGEYLICTGKDDCPAQVSGTIRRWIQKIGVLHFGESLIDLLCESGRINNIADLYRLDAKDVALMDMGGRRVGGTADKAFNNLRAKMTLPLHVFVGSLGIPNVGRTTVQTIMQGGFDSLAKMSKATPAQIAAIPGIGQSTAEAFCDGFWDRLDNGLITDLLGVGIRIEKPKTGTLSGQTFCVTGFRDAALDAAIEAQGGTMKTSVSKGLTTLITKEANSTSGKAQTARKYGTEVVGIDEMWNRLGGKP